MPGKERTVNLDDLKKSGILKQNQKNYFILRTRIPGGHLKSALFAKRLGEGISRIGIDEAKRNIL